MQNGHSVVVRGMGANATVLAADSMSLDGYGWAACWGSATGCGVLLGCRSPVSKSRSPFVSCGTKAGGAASRRAVLLRGDR